MSTNNELRTCGRSATSSIKPSDLLPVEVYDRLRVDSRRALIDCKRRRRVDVGSYLSLLFESRDTVLSQIQEIIWMERPLRAERIAEEIAEYERLIPRAGELTATLMFHGGPCGAGQALAQRLFAGDPRVIFLQLGAQTIDAKPLDPHDDPTCPVQYVYFSLDLQANLALCDQRVTAQLGIEYLGVLQSVALSAETRDELVRECEPGKNSQRKVRP